MEIAPDLPVVRADRQRLLEVFQNLVENAAKFTGGQPAPRVEIGVRRDGEEPVFYVRDNGRGIEPRFLERVFELFEKLDPGADGTGVGLALVRRIVEAHGGRVWAESDGAGPRDDVLLHASAGLKPRATPSSSRSLASASAETQPVPEDASWRPPPERGRPCPARRRGST